MTAAKRRWVFLAALVAGGSIAPERARGQSPREPHQEDARELGQRLRRGLPPSAPLEARELDGETIRIRSAAHFVVGERPVAAVPTLEERAQGRPVTAAEAQKLLGDLDLDRRFTELRRCRGEVALERKVPIDEVLARELLVRFTVAELGKVENVAVLATKPAEPPVLDCVYRKVSDWRFDRLAGARLQLDLPLQFAPPPGHRAQNP